MGSGKSVISDVLSIVLLCKRMKWGFDQYQRQPAWFLKLIVMTDNIEAEYQTIASNLKHK